MWVGARGGSRPRAQKESQVAKAAERATRSTGSAGSRDPAAPLPLPQSSNKLPWMLRFLDSFLSLSHISFAPSWQSVRAVTVQLWKSSQYLARNRTKQKRVRFGRREDPGPARPGASPIAARRPSRRPDLGPATRTPGPAGPSRALGPPWMPLSKVVAAPSRSGNAARAPGRTCCAALAPWPVLTDCRSSAGQARKTVLSLASCRALMPLSSQDWLPARSSAPLPASRSLRLPSPSASLLLPPRGRAALSPWPSPPSPFCFPLAQVPSVPVPFFVFLRFPPPGFSSPHFPTSRSSSASASVLRGPSACSPWSWL